MKREMARGSWELLICLLLAVITLGVYWPVRHFEFLNFDDGTYVTANPHIFRGISPANVAWAFKNLETCNWHPLTWLSHMVDCQVFGYAAGAHHLMSLFFHTANTLILFGLLRYLTGALLRSAIVAALFAWHPLHIESVAWIAERKDVLSTFFGLLALWAYAAYARNRNPNSEASPRQQSDASRFTFHVSRSSMFYLPSSISYVLSLLLFALSLMSKPMLVTLPFLMLLLDYWPLRRFQFPGKGPSLGLRRSLLRVLIQEKLPFFVLSVADCIITTLAQKSAEAIVGLGTLPISSRALNAVVAYAGYLRKMVWPSHLAAYYPYQHHLPIIEVLLALLVLSLVSAVVFRLAARAPYLAFGWLWYLGMLVPVIGLVQVGAQSMADRYTYLPLVGVFIMCVWGLAHLLKRWQHGTVIPIIVSAVVMAACIQRTWVEEKYWHDSESLFRRDLELFPKDNFMAHHCLGRALLERGDDAGAQPHLEEVVRLSPVFVQGQLNLAECLSHQGRYEEAMIHFHDAKLLNPQNPETYLGLGVSLAAQMRLDEARTNFLLAIQFKPDFAQAYMRLGTAEMAQGKVGEAFKHLTAAVAIYPDYYEAQYYLAHALEDQKKLDDAAVHFRAAFTANPGYAEAMNDLASMWLTESQFQISHLNESINLARRACELTQYKHAPYIDTLGIALSEAGQFSEAIQVTERGIAAAEAEGLSDMAQQLRTRLALYRSGRSYSRHRATAAPHPP